MPKAKTLMAYRNRFNESGYKEMVLADQTWLRGHRTRGICSKNHELILNAIDDIFLDLKQSNGAQVFKRYKAIREVGECLSSFARAGAYRRGKLRNDG